MTARCAGVPAPCTSELTSTNPGTDQASDPASAGVRNEVAIKTGAASTNYRRLDVAGSALAGLSTGTAALACQKRKTPCGAPVRTGKLPYGVSGRPGYILDERNQGADLSGRRMEPSPLGGLSRGILVRGLLKGRSKTIPRGVDCQQDCAGVVRQQ
jgi:hypothetical protein